MEENQGTTIKWKRGVDAALKSTEKSWSQWILYLFTGIGPVVIALTTLIYCLQQNYVMKSDLSRMPDYVVKMIPVFFALIGIEAAACWFTGKAYMRLNDSVNSLFQGTCQLIVSAFAKSLIVVPYAFIHENYSFVKATENNYWFLWLGMFLGVEYGYYWFHRFAHEWNALWGSHIAHHSSEEYNLTTALRQGAWQPLFSWMFYIPFAVFFPVELLVFHQQWSAIYQFWIHTRFINKFPSPIEFIFNTPSHHRVHHGRNSQYIDKNYGGTLIVFDRIFKTFEPEDEEVVYGITHSPGSWNPLWVQTHHFVEMWKTAARTPGLFNKLRVFLDFGPGYNFQILFPEEVKNPVKITSQTQVKYDSRMPNLTMSAYGFLHTTAVLVVTFIFASSFSKNVMFVNIVNASYILLSMVTISGLFDNRMWAKWLEIVRMWLGWSWLVHVVAPGTWSHVQLGHVDTLLRVLQQSTLLSAVTAAVVLSTLAVLIKYHPSHTYHIKLIKKVQ